MNISTILVFFCSFLYGVSAVLCKYGLQHESNLRNCSFKKVVTYVLMNKVWAIGVLLSFAANLIIIEVQSYTDLSVVYPILNFSYVFTLLLGYFVLSEKLTKNQMLGITVIILGTILIIMVKHASTGKYTDIGRLVTLSIFSVLIIAGLMGYVYKKKVANYELPYAICTGLAYGNVETYIRANSNMVTETLGYFSVLSMESVLQFFMLWPCLVLLFFAVLGWLSMQVTYSHGDVSITVPLFAVIQSSVSISSGFFIFNEQYTLQKILGVVAIIVGVSIVIMGSISKNEVKIANSY